MSSRLPQHPVQPFQGLVQALREPHRALVDRLHVRLAAAGFDDLRPAHGHVLGFLAPAGNRASELAAMAQLTKQTMQSIIEDLERLGYVERRADPSDARARLVRFTARGRTAARTATAAFQAIEVELAAAMGREKMARLRGLLDDLGAALRDARA